MEDTQSADVNLEDETKKQQDLEAQGSTIKCIYCGKEINAWSHLGGDIVLYLRASQSRKETSICDDCLKEHQMEENALDTEESNPNPMGNMRWITGFFAGLAITALTYFYSSVLYPEFNDVHNDWVFVVAAICVPLSLITGIIGWVVVAWLLKKREVGERAMYILMAFFLIVAVLLFWGISTWDNYLFY